MFELNTTYQRSKSYQKNLKNKITVCKFWLVPTENKTKYEFIEIKPSQQCDHEYFTIGIIIV